MLLGEVVDLDVENRRVILRDGEAPYDDLIVATGATHYYFGNDQWEPLAPGLKTIEDATAIRCRDCWRPSSTPSGSRIRRNGTPG